MKLYNHVKQKAKKNLFLSGLLLLGSCGNGLSGDGGGAVAAMAISSHDKQSGVVQSGSDPGSNGFTEFVTGAADFSDTLDFPQDKALLRVKLQSVPQGIFLKKTDSSGISSYQTGIVKQIVEFNNLHTLFQTWPNHGYGNADAVSMKIKKVEAVYTSPQNGNVSVEVKILPIDKKVFFLRGENYTALVKNGSLPPGSYKALNITFEPTGVVFYDEKSARAAKLAKTVLSWQKPFTVEGNKITTLHSLSRGNHDNGVSSNPRSVSNQDRTFRYWFNQEISSLNADPVNLGFRIHDGGVTVSAKPDKVYLTVSNLAVNTSKGKKISLLRKPTVFEMTSLLDGSVALLGRAVVEDGEYASLEADVTLARIVQTTASGEVVSDVPIHDKLYFMGPFSLKKGMINEVFLRFDPDRSVFALPQEMTFETDIALDSLVSTTKDLDSRLIAALGKRMNLVAADTDFAFVGDVNSLNYILANNQYGKPMIYSNMLLQIGQVVTGKEPSQPLLAHRGIGGVYNGMKLTVTGMPVYNQGDHSLFFLKKTGEEFCKMPWMDKGLSDRTSQAMPRHGGQSGTPCVLAPVRGEWGKIDL